IRDQLLYLLVAEIHLHFWLGDEVVLPDVLHYPDHRAPWGVTGRGAGFQTFTDWVLVGPVMLRRLFTDDNTARRIEGVPVVELPPAHKRDAHRAEVAGASRLCAGGSS